MRAYNQIVSIVRSSVRFTVMDRPRRVLESRSRELHFFRLLVEAITGQENKAVLIHTVLIKGMVEKEDTVPVKWLYPGKQKHLYCT